MNRILKIASLCFSMAACSSYLQTKHSFPVSVSGVNISRRRRALYNVFNPLA